MAKKENNFYFESFIKGMNYASDASLMLKKCFETYDAALLPTQIVEMHAIEHSADMVKHDMMESLVKEFLPPIEREDIVELAHTIDEVTDCIEDVLQRMYMFNITELRSDAAKFTEVISDCCSALKEMTLELHNFRKSTLLREKIIQINNLEEAGDRLYAEAMRTLYTAENDPLVVIRWTAIYERLEKCCDACEHVADMVEQIALKNS